MINKKIQQDDAIFKTLDLKTINRLICYTDKGTLTLQIRKGDTQYHICLDSVPLDKNLNKQLMDLLFPTTKMEIPQINKTYVPVPANTSVTFVAKREVKSKGRPKGSKNR